MKDNVKALVWGIGQDCKNGLAKYPQLLKYICAFVDNNTEMQGTNFHEKKVISSKDIYKYEFDYLVIATKQYALEIGIQLLTELNVDKSRIIELDGFIAKLHADGFIVPTVFYLKVNRNESYTYRNLQHWIDIIEQMPDVQYYILCDKEDLKTEILNNVYFYGTQPQFINSQHEKELNYIVTNTCIESWWNAGYAHLTTFYHARENNYKSFWNIDADDTCLCLNSQRGYELLRRVETYAMEHNIKMFSLDMWRTVVKNVDACEHWTFGITYTDNTIDWLGIMKTHATDFGAKELKITKMTKNIDCYFTYLSMILEEKIETWYCENLKFIHYSGDFFALPRASGFFHWRSGKLLLPIVYYCFGAKRRGLLNIAEDVIKLDIGISDQESMLFLKEYAWDGIDVTDDL